MPNYLQALRDAVDATVDMSTRAAGERDLGYLSRLYLQTLEEMLEVLEDYTRVLERAGEDTEQVNALYKRFISSTRKILAGGTVPALQKAAARAGWRDIEADDAEDDAPTRRDDALFDARDDD